MDNNNDQHSWVDDRLSSLQPDAGWQPDAARALAQLNSRRDRGRRLRLRSAVVLAAGVLTGVGLMAFPAPRAFAQRCVDACSSQADYLQRALEDFERDPYHHLVQMHNHFFRMVHGLFSPARTLHVRAESDRKLAPDFTLTDSSGRAVRLSDFKGRVVLLNFWATWCPPCRQEIPWFVDFQTKYRDRNFVVLGVSLDEDGWKSVQPFMDARKMNYPVMIGNDEVADLYGVKNLPETLIIDRSGKIALNCTGLVGKDEYQAEIEEFLQGGVL